MEKNETPIVNAIKEIYEETNYIVNKRNFVAIGQNISSTQMNETVHIFVVDITNSKRVSKKQGDNSIFENISENK
jgi:ADP-ribose pyrophosphatase YjhB (NUDIX family)